MRTQVPSESARGYISAKDAPGRIVQRKLEGRREVLIAENAENGVNARIIVAVHEWERFLRAELAALKK